MQYFFDVWVLNIYVSSGWATNYKVPVSLLIFFAAFVGEIGVYGKTPQNSI